jgi:fumarate reductase flavoprotein subunit
VMKTRDSFEIEPGPILPEDIKETYTADIVVVGAGVSGKAAALTAAQAGDKIIQIDKHTMFRWNGGHIAAIDTRLQKKLGIKVDKEEVIQQLMRYANNMPDQRLIRLWAEHSGEVIDWLMDMTDADGIETRMYQWPQPPGFDAKTEYYPEFPVCHWHSYKGSTQLNHGLALACVEKHALKLGVEIRYRTRAVRLIRETKGRVTGVIARDPEGHHVQFNVRKAVILCTGDYGSNPAMVEKYCPHAAEIARIRNIYMTRHDDLTLAPEPLNVGDGHLMAMWIGAVMEDGMHAPVAHSTIGSMGNTPFLRVNIKGNRYENEDVPGQSIANQLVRQPEKKVWQVYDSGWEEQLPKMGVGLGRFSEANDMIRQRVRDMAIKADTIEALAIKMEVPIDTFKATVERYNELARNGKDLDFGKRADRMFPLDKPPFYASVIQQEFLVVLGGLNCNIKLQPLDKDWQVIPGMYLAGNTVGNRFAIDYPTMCPGLTHGMAWVTGYFAGKYAAAEKSMVG